MKKALASDSNYLREVREQYENYPYPPRDPEEEKDNFKYVYSSALDRMNYYHYAGKRDFTKGFRALIAGGGTGDATIMLAGQLRGTDAEIIHLDISAASMQVAKKRAKIRGLDNIIWLHGSLLDAPELLKGRFDYIDCTGVLHHLASPEAGLAALASILKEDGVMGIMLYAKYGREGVYQMQNLMRILNKNEPDMQRRIDNCKVILKNLPESSGFKHIENLFTDVNQYGDAGIYDLLLHSNDVAYSVPDIYTFLATSGLKPTHFFFDQAARGNNLYTIESYMPNTELHPVFAALSLQEKQAAAELMHGKIVKHVFYAAKSEAPVPSLNNMDNIPCLSLLFSSKGHLEIAALLESAQTGQTLTFNFSHLEMTFIKTPHSARIFACMDGNRSIADIISHVQNSYPKNEKPRVEELKAEFAHIFSVFNLHDWLFLRDKSVPRNRTAQEIQAYAAPSCPLS